MSDLAWEMRTSELPKPGSGARLVSTAEMVERINRDPERWGKVLDLARREYGGVPTQIEAILTEKLVNAAVNRRMVERNKRAIDLAMAKGQAG